MPYIIPDARIPYNKLIEQMNSNGMFKNIEAQRILISLLKSVPPASQDGQFNYFITKIIVDHNGFYKKIDLESFRNFIIEVMREVYVPVCYENYDRAEGMLICCLLEYKRNHPRAYTLVETFMMSVIEKFYMKTIGEYEDKKRAENGEVI